MFCFAHHKFLQNACIYISVSVIKLNGNRKFYDLLVNIVEFILNILGNF